MRKVVLAFATGVVVVAWMLWPPRGLAHVTTTNTVLFEREIMRILDARCAACHTREGAGSPLVTYEETWLRRDRILASVLERRMPPWSAVPGYGDFANDNGLTARERQFVVSWVEGLGPRNAGELFLNVREDARPGETVEEGAESSGWLLGEPGLIHALPPQVVEPGGERYLERVTLDLGLTSDRWVRALEFRPGDRRVVRSANFFEEGSGQWLGSWTPWYGFATLPEGLAYRLGAGTRLTAEIHYAPAGEPVVDEGTLGLFFAGDTAAEPVSPSELVLEARGDLSVASQGRLEAETEIGEETVVLSLLPQLDAGAQSIEVSARRPDGGTEILLFAKDLSPEWPTPYVMSEPVVLPAASTLRATVYFDNASETARSRELRVRVSVYRAR